MRNSASRDGSLNEPRAISLIDPVLAPPPEMIIPAGKGPRRLSNFKCLSIVANIVSRRFAIIVSIFFRGYIAPVNRPIFTRSASSSDIRKLRAMSSVI